MHTSFRNIAGTLIALAAVAACASSNQYSTNSAAGTVDLAAYPTPELPAHELEMLRGMSDADILGHIILIDSMEVATADSALRIARTDAVLSYARLMVAMHTTDLKAARSLGRQEGITPVQQFGGLRASHVAASLDSIRQASDLTLDRHYIMSQVELHQHVLRELETLQSTAQDAALRNQIAVMIPVVKDHLSRAHAIAVQRGYEKKRT
jgi:predicted outer membrane protein